MKRALPVKDIDYATALASSTPCLPRLLPNWIIPVLFLSIHTLAQPWTHPLCVSRGDFFFSMAATSRLGLLNHNTCWLSSSDIISYDSIPTQQTMRFTGFCGHRPKRCPGSTIRKKVGETKKKRKGENWKKCAASQRESPGCMALAEGEICSVYFISALRIKKVGN